MTSVLTAPNQNLWIELMQERLASDYPDMTIAEILPGNDDQQQAQQVTRTYMQANPDTTGIWVMGGGMPGAVLALQQLGIDPEDVPVTGLCIPSVVRDYLKDGSIKDCSLWDPTDLGYAAVYGIDYQLRDELPFGESTTIEVGELGELSFEDDTITLGDPVDLHRREHRRLRLLRAASMDTRHRCERPSASAWHRVRVLIRGGFAVTLDPGIGDVADADVLIEGERIAVRRAAPRQHSRRRGDRRLGVDRDPRPRRRAPPHVGGAAPRHLRGLDVRQLLPGAACRRRPPLPRQ